MTPRADTLLQNRRAVDEVSFSEYGGVSERAECGGELSTARRLSRRILKGREGESEAKMPKQLQDRQWCSALQEE